MRQGNPDDPRRNHEGYADPTAYNAIYFTADEQNARNYLNQYYVLTKKIAVLERDLTELAEEASGVSINLDGMPHGTDVSDRTARLAVKIADYYDNRRKLREQAWDKRREIAETIEKLPNINHVELLKLRYIHRMTWEHITVEIDKSWTQTHRLHHIALQELAKIL